MRSTEYIHMIQLPGGLVTENLPMCATRLHVVMSHSVTQNV